MTTENNTIENNETKTIDNQTEDSGNSQNPSETVPLKTFLDKKQELKDYKAKVAAFEAKEVEYETLRAKKVGDKLLEDEKYQELIQLKDKEVLELSGKLDSEIKNNKLEKIRNKFSSELTKLNAVDSEDALKFIAYDDLLDSEDFSSELKNRVETLAKNKSYLFKAGAKIDTKENGVPAPGNNSQPKGNSKMDPLLMSLAQKFKRN